MPMSTMKKPSASNKSAATVKRPASSVLTSKNLKSHRAGTPEDSTQDKIAKLEDKMKRYKDGAITQDNFSDDDKHKLWDRFHNNLRKNDDATAAFESIVGHGKQEKKNQMLFAWIKDPLWGKTFSTLTRPV